MRLWRGKRESNFRKLQSEEFKTQTKTILALLMNPERYRKLKNVPLLIQEGVEILFDEKTK